MTAPQVKHRATATTPDDGTSEVGSNEWNDTHAMTVSQACLLGATAAGDAAELTPDQARVLLGLIGVSVVARAIYKKLVAWYDMDETSGTVMYDAHVNGLNGTYSGVTLNQTGLTANTGASVSFPANTAYAEVADDALFRSARNLSCMVWIKRNGAQPGFAKIMWKAAQVQANGNANFMLQQDNTNNGGKASFRVTQSSNSANVDNLSSAALADLTVYHLVGNRINDQAQLWRNGAKEGTNAAIGDLWTGGNFTLRLGNATGSDGFVGYYGQAAVFNDALTPVEIAYLYNSGAGVSYTRLQTDAGYNTPRAAAPDAAGVQIGYTYTATSTTASDTGANPIPRDNTIPQNTEGSAFAALDTTYTPKYANSLLEIEVSLPLISANGLVTLAFAMFRDSGADAIAAKTQVISGTDYSFGTTLRVVVPATSTAATTFKLRWAGQSGVTAYINKLSSADYFGGAIKATMTVREIKQ